VNVPDLILRGGRVIDPASGQGEIANVFYRRENEIGATVKRPLRAHQSNPFTGGY
jgi:predicted amidohydrolase